MQTSKKTIKLAVLALAMSSCTKFEGTYSDPAKAEIVDDKWSETDARKTAEVLIQSALNKPWLPTFTAENKGKKPVLLVDQVENRTDEHIDTKALTEFVRNELLNSGKISFVNESRRQKIIDEIKYQNSGMVSNKTKKSAGRQIGADFMMGGAVSTSVHSMDNLKTVTYQINLTLTNLETAEIVWSENYQIKKRFNRPGAKW